MECKSFFTFRSFFVFGICLFFATASFAVMDDSSCFEHYRYGGLEFDELYPEKVSYLQGDEVKINYNVVNAFPGPLVEGGVRVIVLYRGPDDIDRMEDDDIVDEFFAVEDLAIQKDDVYTGSFSWAVPADARPGAYVVNVYFPVKRRFNIAGLPFMTSVPGATTSFRVEGGDSGWFMLDKNATKLNGKAYKFREYIPGFEEPADVTLEARLLNPSNKEVGITYELFSWSDIEERLDQYTRTETVSPKGVLEYSLEGLPAGVYVARVTASAGDLKSVLNARFFVKGAKGKINWLGLDHFPIMEGDDARVSLCLSNSAVDPGDSSINFTVKGKVSVLDRAGNVLAEETYDAPVTANILGKTFSFPSSGKLTYVVLKADMYDEKGALMDEAEIVYDYTKFVNIRKVLTLEAPGEAIESIDYKVGYADEYGDALSGVVVVYLIAPDGSVVEVQEKQVTGFGEGSFVTKELAKGAYVLKTVEKGERLSQTKDIKLVKEKAPEVESTTTAPPTEPVKEEEPKDNTWMIIIVIIVLIVLLLAVMKTRKK